MTKERIALGREGEDRAVSLLKAKGYTILERNVRTRFGEIDLVARQGGVLCFVEIKARSSEKFGLPEEGVRWVKQKRLARLASWYVATRRLGDTPIRFDVFSLTLSPEGRPSLPRLIQGAFSV